MSTSPATKKQKTANGSASTAAPCEVVRGDLMQPASRKALREAFKTAEPYTHAVLKDVFDSDLLKQVREEIIHNIQATYKETDLFKVFQTGDLANLQALDPESAAKLPALMKLRDAVYSDEFRAFIREITGCGELSTKTDCSCNVYAQGGHLLVHDDVIATRRISWIIYLTDPDEGWTEADGGALELYPLAPGAPHTPAVNPTVNLLPLWNTMAFFTVLPGRSFHAVQEVLAADKPRMSISGWYHAPQLDPDFAKASLNQLQAGADQHTSYVEFSPAGGEPTGELTASDKEALSNFINPVYLAPNAWKKVLAQFKDEGSIQLQRFLKDDVANAIRKATAAEDAAEALGCGRMPAYEAGCRDGWSPVGPPHKQRYLRYDGSSTAATTDAANGAAKPASAGALLAQLKEELFTTAAFARLLKALTTIGFLGHQAEVRRFRPGLDYTVAHYGILTKDPRLDCVLTFVDDEGDDKRAAWDSGEVGGFEAYLLADEQEDGPADTYRQDKDESGVLNVSAASNSLNLVLRDEGLMKFVKYVGAQAPGSRWDVAVEYCPEDDSSEEGEEEK